MTGRAMRLAALAAGCSFLVGGCWKKRAGSTCNAKIPKSAVYVDEVKDAYCVQCEPSIEGWFDCTVFEASSAHFVSSHRLRFSGGDAFRPGEASEFADVVGDGIALSGGRHLLRIEPPRPGGVPKEAVWVLYTAACSAFEQCAAGDFGALDCRVYDDMTGELVYSGLRVGPEPRDARAFYRTLGVDCCYRGGRRVVFSRRDPGGRCPGDD